MRTEIDWLVTAERIVSNKQKTPIDLSMVQELWNAIEPHVVREGWSAAFLVHLSNTTYALSFQYVTADAKSRKKIIHDDVPIVHKQRTAIFRTTKPLAEVKPNGTITRYYKPMPMKALDNVLALISSRAKTNNEVWVANCLGYMRGAAADWHYEERQKELRNQFAEEAKRQKAIQKEAKERQERLEQEAKAAKKAQQEAQKKQHAYEKRKRMVLHQWKHRKETDYKNKREFERWKRAKEKEYARMTPKQQAYADRKQTVITHWFHRKEDSYRKMRQDERHERALAYAEAQARAAQAKWESTFPQWYAEEEVRRLELQKRYFGTRRTP